MSAHDSPATSGRGISAEIYEARRTSFGGAAVAYDRVRPEWPATTLTWLLGSPSGPLDVLDLGAGTGKGTRTLADLGHRVVAVEPAEGMLEVLRDRLDGRAVQVVQCGAESLALPDASVDAITCLQAWHWVDPELAGPECARVLRPGGWLGLAWHQLDLAQPWIRELYDLCRRPEAAADSSDDDEPAMTVPGFGPVETWRTTYAMQITPADLRTQVASWSHIAIHPEREQILADVLAFAEERAGGADVLTLPHVTDCLRARAAG